MNNQDKHITPWSASDVQKYLKGELSAGEMHQLEKAALEDPFLADAIEGLSQRPAAPLAGDLEELQTRLNAHIGKKRKRTIAWLKMAAAIVLLLGLGYTAWFILIVHPTPKVAQTASTPSVPATADSGSQTSRTAEPPATNATAQAPTVDSTSIAIGSSLAAARKSHTPVRIRKNIGPVSGASLVKPEADSIDVVMNNKASGLDIAPSAPSRMVMDSAAYKFRGSIDLNQVAKRANTRADFERVHKDEWQQNVVYNGQVLDQNNRPLAGAFLQVSGTSNAIATTNALGQFKLNLRPQDTARQLTVALSGYQNASLAVNRLKTEDAVSNTIFLKENPIALGEVVVNRKGRSEAFAIAPFDDKNEKLDSFWVKVSPVNGRLAYLDYLQTGKKNLPVDTTIQGAEVISFAIGPKGEPTDFKIEHSLSPAHDAGVIRLITEGARWRILHGKNVRAMVHVSFP